MSTETVTCKICGQAGEHDGHIAERCAWCPDKKFIRFVPGDPMNGKVTHGMCDECRKDWIWNVDHM